MTKHAPSYRVHEVKLDPRHMLQLATVPGYPKVLHAHFENFKSSDRTFERHTLLVYVLLDESQPESTMTFRILDTNDTARECHPGAYLCTWRTSGSARRFLFHDETGPIHTERRDGQAHPPAYQNPGETGVPDKAFDTGTVDPKFRTHGMSPVLGMPYDPADAILRREGEDSADFYARVARCFANPEAAMQEYRERTMTAGELGGVTLKGDELCIAEHFERELLALDVPEWYITGKRYAVGTVLDLAVMFDQATFNTAEWWTGRIRRATVENCNRVAYTKDEYEVTLRIMRDVLLTVDPADLIAQVMARRTRFPNEPKNPARGPT